MIKNAVNNAWVDFGFKKGSFLDYLRELAETSDIEQKEIGRKKKRIEKRELVEI